MGIGLIRELAKGMAIGSVAVGDGEAVWGVGQALQLWPGQVSCSHPVLSGGASAWPDAAG